MTDDLRKLLGGYATGTLTLAERDLLFRAALADQDLFNELAAEQPLRELFSDPGARAELLASLAPAPQRPANQLPGWIFSGAVAACALAVFWIALRPQLTTVASRVFQPPPPAAGPLPLYPSPMEVPPSLPPRAFTAPVLPLPPLRPAATTADASRRLKVAVLDFESGSTPQAGQSVSNYLNDKLVSDRVYSVIPRGRVQRAVSRIAENAPPNPAQAARIGRQLGADAVVLGRVAQNGFADSSMIESATGRKMRDVKTIATSMDLKSAAVAIGVALEREARVAKIDGDLLTLSIASTAGIKPGDTLTVSRNAVPLGALKVTSVLESSVVGRYTGAPARIGDRAVPVALP